MLNSTQKQCLLDYAMAVIRNKVVGSPCPAPEDEAYQVKRGIFVSLHIDGALRGCIGYILPYKSIVESVKEMAVAAAFRDPRFPPVSKSELPDLQVEISILSEMIPVDDPSEIQIGRDGLYVDHPEGSGLLLPQVAVEWNWDVPQFLKHLENKAGLPAGALRDPESELFRFSAEVFSTK